MRTAHLAAATLALALLATCRPHAQTASARPRPAAPPPPPPAVQPLPLAEPSRPTAVPGAAERIAHPNEGVTSTDLGARVNPRPLPLPRVATGQSARFTFDGGHRGWVVQLSNQLLATPAYSRDRVYVGAGFSSNTVYAFDAHTGELKWTGATPDGGPTAAIIEDDSVLFNTESCTLFAFDARTGRLRWSRWLGDPLMSQPAAAQGRVFSAYPDREAPTGFSFTALSVRTGRVLWHRPIRADVLTAPVIDGDSVYFSTMDGWTYRVQMSNGRTLWSRGIGATSAPVVHAGQVSLAQRMPGGRERQVLLAADNGHTLTRGDAVRAPYAAIRADTGGTESGWSYEGSRPSYADGRLYYAMGDQVVARDAQTGATVWQRRYPRVAPQRGVTSPAVVGGVLVVGTRDGDIFGLDIDTGITTWAYRVGEPIAFQPTVANGWVYATTARGKVLGFEVGDREFDGWHQWGGSAGHNGLAAREPATATSEALPPQGTLRAATSARGAHAVNRHSGPTGTTVTTTITPPGAHPHPAERGGGPADASEPAFALLHTSIHADVAGYVARVSVEQTFANPFDRPTDAEYLLPLPANAAVDAMDMHIGERVVHGEIQRRADARATFEHARNCGQRAALLEQDRPNLFRQAVANIPPHETIRVVVRFAATVPFHDGTYELALPLSTGSRFTPGQGAVAPTRPPGDVELSARVDMGAALDSIDSPSHPVTITREGDSRATLALTQGSALPDRDFVLRYAPRVRGAEPAVLAARAGAEGFFTLMLHPDAADAASAPTPRELVFLVDTSSSMRGTALAQSQAVLRRALDGLREGDTFRLVRFSDTVSALAPDSLSATPDNRARARAWVDALQAAGSTDMLPGLRAALAGREDPARVRLVVLLTDGYIGNEREVLGAVEQSVGTSRIFAFGVGAATNRYLLEQVAEVGRGHAEVIAPSEDPTLAAERFYAHIDRAYLTDIAIDWGGLDVHDVYPRIVPDLFADRPVLVHARYVRAGAGDVRITGRVRGRAFERVVHVALPERAADHEALPAMWARARVHELTRAMILGETADLREQVAQLGLRFALVTDYTSFVAVDNEGALSAACRGHVPPGGSSGSLGGIGASAMGYGYGGGSASGYAMGSGQTYGGSTGLVLRYRQSVLPIIRAAPPVVMGLLPPEAIRRVLLRNMAPVRACYQQSLIGHPEVHGRLVVRFVIGASGQVIAAQTAADSTGSATLGECVLNVVRRIAFPEPPDVIVTVNYPFTFEAVEPERERIPIPLEVLPPAQPSPADLTRRNRAP